MNEEFFRQVLREELSELKSEFGGLRSEFGELRSELHDELKASEERLAENGRMQFRQLGDLYRALLSRFDHVQKHLGDQIGATRGAIEALRSSLERQDFRSDTLGRRITELELHRGSPNEE
jgi:hypothetical protein